MNRFRSSPVHNLSGFNRLIYFLTSSKGYLIRSGKEAYSITRRSLNSPESPSFPSQKYLSNRFCMIEQFPSQAFDKVVQCFCQNLLHQNLPFQLFSGKHGQQAFVIQRHDLEFSPCSGILEVNFIQQIIQKAQSVFARLPFVPLPLCSFVPLLSIPSDPVK